MKKINNYTHLGIIFLILAFLTWQFYQIPAITIGDKTYAIFIFLPFLSLAIGSVFIAFHFDEESRKKHEAYYRKNESMTYYRSKKKKKTKKEKKKREQASVAVAVIVGIIGPAAIGTGIFGFPYGAPDPIAVYENPTYAEMVIFIAQDSVDQNEYIYPDYKCTHFTEDFVDNARDKGLRAGYVRLNNPGGTSHAIACFFTTDAGLYFVEPQTDDIFSISEMEVMVDNEYYPPTSTDFTSYTIDWYNPIWT